MNMMLQNKTAAIQLPLRTCLFTPGISTWDFFGNDVTDVRRDEVLDWLVKNGMNSMIFLLTAYADECPHKINFFENNYGGDLNLNKIYTLLKYAKMFHNVNAAFVPCLFNDDKTAYAASFETQIRVIHVLTGLLNPYVPAYLIGLESPEYLDDKQHKLFYDIFKHFAPNHYIGTHAQGIVPGMDFLAYEHKHNPNNGDLVSPEDVATEGKEIMQKAGMPVWMTEYNTNFTGGRIREQSRALAALNPAPVGIGGPC